MRQEPALDGIVEVEGESSSDRDIGAAEVADDDAQLDNQILEEIIFRRKDTTYSFQRHKQDLRVS